MPRSSVTLSTKTATPQRPSRVEDAVNPGAVQDISSKQPRRWIFCLSFDVYTQKIHHLVDVDPVTPLFLLTASPKSLLPTTPEQTNRA